MNIIFLDFDGVLNNVHQAFNLELDKIMVKKLTDFCVDNKIKIVFSTSWRKNVNYTTADLLKNLLIKNGGNSNLECVGVLPDFSINLGFDEKYLRKIPHRGLEIQFYLEQQINNGVLEKDNFQYVILDDTTKILFPGDNIVVTDGWVGLVDKDLNNIKDVFDNNKGCFNNDYSYWLEQFLHNPKDFNNLEYPKILEKELDKKSKKTIRLNSNY